MSSETQELSWLPAEPTHQQQKLKSRPLGRIAIPFLKTLASARVTVWNAHARNPQPFQ